MIPLLLYGDLSKEEARTLEEHLATCKECRNELDRTRKLHSLLTRVPASEPIEAHLKDARLQFSAGLISERKRPSLRDWIADLIPSSLPPWPAVALGGVALIALGFFAGRLISPSYPKGASGTDNLSTPGGAIRVTNIRLISSEQPGGDIELTYDAVQSVYLRGSLNDASVQRVLAYALVNGENAGIRIRAANSVMATQSAAPEREIKAALLLALKSDQNDGVRREAMRTLLRFPADREVRDALLFVLLHDANPGLRVGAINALDTLRMRGYQPDETQRETFRQIVQNDKNLYVRVKAQSILEEKLQ